MTEPYGQSQQAPNEAATLLEQTNPLSLLIRFQRELGGEVYDETQGEYVKVLDKPHLNRIGVSNLSLLLGGMLNTNSILSNYTDQDIKMAMIDFSDDVTDNLVLNYKKYDMEKRSISTIIGICRRYAYAALRRAYLGGEKEFLKKTSKEVISTTTQQRQPKNDNVFFGLFNKK